MLNLEKIKAKEEAELKSLRRKQAKPEYALLLFVLLCLVTLINIVDETSSVLGSSVQSSVVTEFFVNGMGLSYNDGLSRVSLIATFGSLMMLVIPFYKALGDRLGRKALLVFSSFGIGLSLLICFFSSTYITFFVGLIILQFFVGHDMQIVYVLESAPTKSRARIYSTVKFLGILGVVLIPILRSTLMGNDATRWRMIFIVPAFLAIGAAVIALFSARETGVFVKSRIAYLEKPYDERLAEKKQKKANSEKSGVFNGIKHLFSTRDLKWQTISYMVFFIGAAAMSMYYESIMSVGGMSTEAITQALFMYPFVYAALTLVSGFVADLVGRKQTIVAFAIVAMAAFFLFIKGAGSGWNPYLVGSLYGLYLGCYWVGCDYQIIMTTEKVPTSIRLSSVAAMGLLRFGGMLLGLVTVTFGMRYVSIGTICLAVSVPAIIASIVIMALTVKESKGADMDSAGIDSE